MGNPLSNLALIAWPLVCLAAFARFKPTVAILIAFMGAMLFLPEKVELKAPFQPLGKQEFAAIGAILGVVLVGAARRKLIAAKPFRSAEVIGLVMMIGAFGTSQTNQEPLNYGMANLEPLTTWEAISVCFGHIYTYLIPFVLGRAMFTTRDDARTLSLVRDVTQLRPGSDSEQLRAQMRRAAVSGRRIIQRPGLRKGHELAY